MSNLQYLLSGVTQQVADVGFAKSESGQLNVSIDTLNALKSVVNTTSLSPSRLCHSPLLRGRSSSPLPELASEDLAFSKTLITGEVPCPDGYELRPLAAADFDKGYLECLAQLTTVGNISKEQYLQRYKLLKDAKGIYFPIVIEQQSNHKIVALGTILIERKFIHENGSVGHIEDICVHDSMRGKNFGRIIIDQLKAIGVNQGCYKIILNCNEKNIGFYSKLGFEKKEVEMVYRV